MKHIFILFLVATVIMLHVANCTKDVADMKRSKEDIIDIPKELNVEFPFVKVNVPNNIVYSKQPKSIYLESLLEKGVIRTVIRLNGDGLDGGDMKTSEESRICNKYGVSFLQINAHKGYSEGKGYVQSGQEIAAILTKGNVLIHCKHGYHRARAMVGYWLRQQGWPYEEVVKELQWEKLVAWPSKYYKYIETIY